MDQSTNTKDPFYIPNGSITMFKAKTLKKALNGLIVQVSAKTELKDLLEHQEEALMHLIYV